MIYVIGDIHGKKDKYDEMLAKLSPKETDAVFVLGDIIDIGDDSIEILQDMNLAQYFHLIDQKYKYLLHCV